MKVLLLSVLVLLCFLQPTATQNTQEDSVYNPFTAQELSQLNVESSAQIVPQHPQPRHHDKKHHKPQKHMRPEEDQLLAEAQGKSRHMIDEEYGNDLTQQEKEERRHERRRYNKIFRIGMIAGTAVLAVIVFKFCKAKRLRNRQRYMQNLTHQQPQQPYLYNINPAPVVLNPNAYPSPHVQMGRPFPQPEQVQPQLIRGRVHDSFIREPQQVENPMEAQVRFHENEILRLKQMKRQECELKRREMEMQRMPVNTTESFETQHPMNRYRGVPVGQPIYKQDANSSFASEYPEI